MTRNSLTKSKFKKNQSKHKNIYEQPSQNSNQIKIKLLIGQNQEISITVPLKCPITDVTNLLNDQFNSCPNRQLIGFETVPSNFLLDYKMSKNVGFLTEAKDINLRCLYKNLELQNEIKKYQQLKKNLHLLNQSSFYKLNKYKICKSLSSGGFSRVYLVRSLLNGKFFAAKFMDKDSQANIDRCDAIRNEFLIHKSLNHPYIVQMEEYIETQQFYILIMEYCPGGQLFTLLKNNRYMDQSKAKIIFLQILLAIKYLHDKNIIFRDIKPENILIDEKGNAKLTDFGLAKQIRGKTNSYCGSVQYMAPQIVSKQTYSFDVDLYCMGALLYEILIGCPPFYNPNFSNNQTKYHICNSDVSFPNKVKLSDSIKELILTLLVKNPSERFGHEGGADQILNHEWIGSTNLNQYLSTQIQCPFVPSLDTQNFDRQDDPYEYQFRIKIAENVRYCKKLLISLNDTIKSKLNSDSKSKSKSISLLKKHTKSQSLVYNSKHDKVLSIFVNKNREPNLRNSQKSNPYHFQLLKSKKSFQQQFMDTCLPAQGLKKKKPYKSSSHSLHKPSSKMEMSKMLLINTKSYSNSRRPSLHNDTSLKPTDFKRPFSPKQLSNQNESLKSSKKFILSKNAFLKQNDPKQLKRKAIPDKKKFFFSTLSKTLTSKNPFQFARQSIC